MLSDVLLEISESVTADGGMMKPGFFEAHYSEPTVLDALVLGPKQTRFFDWPTEKQGGTKNFMALRHLFLSVPELCDGLSLKRLRRDAYFLQLVDASDNSVLLHWT